MAALIGSLRALGGPRIAALAIVAAISLGLLGFIMVRGTDGPMTLLYADLDLRDGSQIVDQLARAHIPHQIEAGGTRVLVPADQVSKARLLLAKESLPTGGSIGYEIFDRGDGLTASSFQQSINQTRALEGELSRTIRVLQGVRAARVHLVLPKREPFARDRQEAQASVVLTMAGAARLDKEGVQAVLNLISAAVPGLRPQNIAVIDSRGGVLAKAGQVNTNTSTAGSADDVKHAGEQRLAHAVEEMLERSLGVGHVRAEASLDYDYEQVRETQEKFDPDGQVVRSQQNTTNSSRSTEAPPAVTVQNNLPNADASGSPAGSQEQRQDETTNYEVSKTVRTLVREQPLLRRLSVAVMVDGTSVKNPDGSVVWTERSAEDLARISSLVRSAIGFNELRGDKVEVISLRFVATDETLEPSPDGFFARFDKADVMRLAETGIIGFVAIICLMFVFRPMVLRLTTAPAQPVLSDASLETAGIPALTGPGSALDAMVDLADAIEPLKSSAITRVAAMIDRHPDESVTVLRNWVLNEQGA